MLGLYVQFRSEAAVWQCVAEMDNEEKKPDVSLVTHIADIEGKVSVIRLRRVGKGWLVGK